jgi:hypothetical protein
MISDKVMNHTEYPKKCKKMSVEALKYTIADCKKAIEANAENPNCSYYQDEILYCGMELRKRGLT